MKASFLILLLFNFAFSATTLKGDISGKVFSKKDGPFIIEKDIVIMGNKPTVMEAGCLFLFKSFVGMKISGSLLVKGTRKSPVIFTSIDNIVHGSNIEKESTENSFDWNGIIIELGAKEVVLENFELSNSVFGLKSNTSKIVVHHGTFKDNGDLNFIIKDELLDVKEGIPYDYGIISTVKKGSGNIAKVIRISSFSISSAALGSMGWSFYKANLYQEKYSKSKNAIQMFEYKQNKELCLKEARNLGIVGAAFFTIGLGALICRKGNSNVTNVSFFITPQRAFVFLCKDI